MLHLYSEVSGQGTLSRPSSAVTGCGNSARAVQNKPGRVTCTLRSARAHEISFYFCLVHGCAASYLCSAQRCDGCGGNRAVPNPQSLLQEANVDPRVRVLHHQRGQYNMKVLPLLTVLHIQKIERE